jgi:hypothetical protein
MLPDRHVERTEWQPDELDPQPAPPPEPQSSGDQGAGYGGSPAFWERRYLRRWQTGLVR